MGYNETAEQTQTDRFVAPCKLRVNRSAKFDLSTAWQRVDFSGNSALNGNSFPTGADGLQMVRWDPATKLLRLNSRLGNQYKFDFYVAVTSTSALLSVGGLTVLNLANIGVATVQMRYVIPIPGAAFYFPFPDSQKCLDTCTAGFTTSSSAATALTITPNADMQTYGLGIDLRLSNAVAGAASVVDTNLLIHGR